MEPDTFSKRIGIRPEMKKITIRNDAPTSLRRYLFVVMKDLILSLKTIRALVCKTIREAPDPNNWGENDFMVSEIQGYLDSCEWYRIYDIIENFYEELDSRKRVVFSDHINEFFFEKGIGWKLDQGKILSRGDNITDEVFENAKSTLKENGFPTSENELTEAISDLSRRPNPEITGSIQHAIAALECVCREITGSNSTLGQLVKSNPQLIPKPLDSAIEKLYGYVSEHGRHLHEGGNPDYDEAFLVVHIASAVCTYLLNKKPSVNLVL